MKDKKQNDQKPKKEKLPWKRSVSNNLYILKMVAEASPLLIPFMLISTVVSSLTNTLVGVYMFQYVLNALTQGVDLRRIMLTVCALFAASAVSEIVSCLFWQWFQPVAYAKVEVSIQKKLQKKAAEVELSCYERPEFFDKFIKASDEATNRAMNVLYSVRSFLWALTTVLANVALVLSISPIFLPFSVAPAIFTVIFGKKVNRLSYEKDMKMKEETRRRDYVRRTFYLADYAKEMRLTNIKEVMLGRMHENTGRLWKLSTYYGNRLSFLNPFVWMVPFWLISYLGTVLFAAYRVLVLGVMQVGDCFVVVNSINSVSGNLEWLFDNLLSFDKHALYIENLREFLNYEVKIADDQSAPSPATVETLSLRDVCFTYEGAQKPTLKKVSFDVKKGEKIAIVGHNGAGKTTLVKLLMRLYDPTEGEILLNGESIKNYRLSAYRELFGTVFQDCRLFSVSVAENVLLRDDLSEADREHVKNALAESDALERVEGLERGMDTTVTREFDENGVVFSGGETQKIAIARVFAGNSEIAILDEPSSALDPIAESKMYENMFRVCRDKTVIFISHRLSSATMADRVYLFENGEIAECGTHSELLALGGKYADMWHKQAQKYVGEEVEA